MTMLTRSNACAPTYSRKRRRNVGVLSLVLAAQRIWRERQTLKTMDEHRLKDIGLTEADARKEARRRVWDAPDQWLR